MYWLAAVTLVVGALISAWYFKFLDRPKVRVRGGGGGGMAQGQVLSLIRVENVEGFVGIRLQPTTIFGTRIHNYIDWGMTFGREPAVGYSAWLMDWETKKHIRQLGCRKEHETETRLQTMTMGTSEAYYVMVFARLQDEKALYFIHQPSNSGDLSIVPSQSAKLAGNSKFYVQIQDSRGKKKARVPVGMVQDMSGGLRVNAADSGGMF